MKHRNFSTQAKTRKNQLEKRGRSSTKTKAIIILFLCLFLLASSLFGQKDSTNENSSDRNLRGSSRINPSTLAMEISIPLGVYPGRNGNSIPIAVNYSSKVWTSAVFETEFHDSSLGQNPPSQTTRTVNRFQIARFDFNNNNAGWNISLQPPRIVPSEGFFVEHPDTAFGYAGSSRFVVRGLGSPLSAGVDIIQVPTPPDNCPQIIREEWTIGSDGIKQIDGDSRFTFTSCPFGDFSTNGGYVGGTTRAEQANNSVLTTVARMSVRMPNGSMVEFRKNDNKETCGFLNTGSCINTDLDGSYLAVDGSGMRLENGEVQPNGKLRHVLYLPNGDRYLFPELGSPHSRDAEKFIDNHGNTGTYDAATRTWTDTLGATIVDPFPEYEDKPFNSKVVPQYPRVEGTDTIDLPGLAGQSRQASMVWAKLNGSGGNLLEDTSQQLKYVGSEECGVNKWNSNSNQSALFQGTNNVSTSDIIINSVVTGIRTDTTKNHICGHTEDVFNPVVLKEVVLPNGSKYEFKYNLYGEITKVIYPTGSVETFIYGEVPPLGFGMDLAYSKVNRGVLERRIYENTTSSTPSQVWKYDASIENFIKYKVKITAPDNSYSERYINRSHRSVYGFTNSLDGLTYESKLFGTDGRLLSRSLTEWIQKGPLPGGSSYASRDPRVSKTVSIAFEDGQTNALATLSTTEYDENGSPNPKHFSHLNPIRTKSYKYKSLDLNTATTSDIGTIALLFDPTLPPSPTPTPTPTPTATPTPTPTATPTPTPTATPTPTPTPPSEVYTVSYDSSNSAHTIVAFNWTSTVSVPASRDTFEIAPLGNTSNPVCTSPNVGGGTGNTAFCNMGSASSGSYIIRYMKNGTTEVATAQFSYTDPFASSSEEHSWTSSLFNNFLSSSSRHGTAMATGEPAQSSKRLQKSDVVDIAYREPFETTENSSKEVVKSAPTVAQSVDLAAVTETDYLYDASYLARGITSIPTETRVLDPTNLSNVLGKVQTKFDESAYPILSSGSTTGWVDPNSNLRGNATTNRTWIKESNTWIETHAQYDNFGNPRKATDAKGNVAETQYDSVNKFAYPTKSISTVPDPSGNNGSSTAFETTTTYDFTTGLVLSATDANGNTSTTEYNDSLLRPTAVVAPNGARTETEYGDTSGNIFVKTRSQFDTNVWVESTAFADNLGRGIKTQTKDVNGDVFTETEYDNMNRVKRVTNPYRSGDIKLYSLTTYDEEGRAKETFSPAPNGQTGDSLGTTEYGFINEAGLVGTFVVGIDASGRKGRSVTNSLGQLARVDEATNFGGTITADLGSLSSPNQATSYKYDVFGKMVEVTQGVQKRHFHYDALGRLIRVRQPEQEVNTALNLTGENNSQWTAGFEYDDNGNLLKTTDAKGVVITNTYDNLNRVKTRSYSDSTPTVTYKYDNLPNAKGALIETSNSVSISKTTQFDSFGRPTEYQQITDGQTYTSKYTYNLSGALVEEEYPTGRKVKNDFDANGDILKIHNLATSQSGAKTFADSFKYTPFGGISEMKLGNGKFETAKFNNRLQVTQLGLGNSNIDTSLWQVDYEFGELNANGTVDSAKNTGNIAKQTVSFSGLSQPFVQQYKYDALYRLTEAKEAAGSTQNWKQEFGYDRYGNRTSYNKFLGTSAQTLTAKEKPTIDVSNNRFNSGQGYNYDKAGNILSNFEGWQFTFNGDNKQTEVKDSAGNVIGTYFYNGDGMRIKKVTNSETVVFVYSGGKKVAEYSNDLAVNTSTKYLTEDHLGTPRVISDQSGSVLSRRDMMPFGEDLKDGVGARNNALKYGIDDKVREGFTGYEKDKETGLDFAEARMYENRHGRFTAVDPLLTSGNGANPQTFNRYVYVGNSPIRRIDLDGLDWYEKNGRFLWSSDNKTFDRTFGQISSPERVDQTWTRVKLDESGEHRYWVSGSAPGTSQEIILRETLGWDFLSRWSYGENKIIDQEAFDTYQKERVEFVTLIIDMLSAVSEQNAMNDAFRPMTKPRVGPSLIKNAPNRGFVFDRMKSRNGSPKLGNSATTLGGRQADFKSLTGKSVAPNPAAVPGFKKKGTALFCIPCRDLKIGTAKGDVNHLYLQPRKSIKDLTFDEYQDYIISTQFQWKLFPEDKK